MCKRMYLCVYAQKPVDRSVLGIMFHHSPPYSFETGSLIATAAGLTASKTQQASYSTPNSGRIAVRNPATSRPCFKQSERWEPTPKVVLWPSDLHRHAWHMHDLTHTHEYVHTCAHISYTVKFFKMQEKHIRGTYICKKIIIIPNSLLGNVYWVVILLVCRGWEGKESSSAKQEDTAQVQSSDRVPAAPETEVERSCEPTNSRQACTMQWDPIPAPPKWQSVLPPALMTKLGAKIRLQFMNRAGAGALGEKRPFQSEFIGRGRQKKKRKKKE